MNARPVAALVRRLIRGSSRWAKPRVIVLSLLWLLPTAVYLTLGLIALFQTGWLTYVVISLPIVWVVSWMVAHFWKPDRIGKYAASQAIVPQSYWTTQDSTAVALIEDFRRNVSELAPADVFLWERYVSDARALASILTTHYHSQSDDSGVANITLLELLTVMHLAAEDLEFWVQKNVPGSGLLKFKYFRHAPVAAKTVDWVQSGVFAASVLLNPARALSYPLWRMSGKVVTELQLEVIQAFYQHYLQAIGFYLIEMYSGRLRGGAVEYNRRFRQLSRASHEHSVAGGDIVADAPICIAVMGQVKAGKSSLINRLIGSQSAAVSSLPMTKEIQRFELDLPGTPATLTLLDTPGYAESGASRQQKAAIDQAAKEANVILLVLNANSPARQADVEIVTQIREFYQSRPNLKFPILIAVLTHVDMLRPIGEWNPPYDWNNPRSAKEKSLQGAVSYANELFGDTLQGIACVCTGESTTNESSVSDALIPIIIQNLPEGKAIAMLKGYYKQISDRRLSELTEQVGGLVLRILEGVLRNDR